MRVLAVKGSPMFKKLRIQFVAIVMTSVALVLAIVFSGICITEYQHSKNDVNEAMDIAINRAGEKPFGLGRFGSDEGLSDNWANDSEADDDRGGPRIGGRGKGDDKRITIPVAVYALTTTNTFTIASGYTTATIEYDVLQSAAISLSDADEGYGTLSDLGLHYLKRYKNGTMFVAFTDTTVTDSWKSLALTLVIAGLGTLAVFFFIALALSNWALKPVKEAWEAQRQFVADASHDLKTPLTVILANSSILLKHPERTIASESQWIESTQIEAQQMQGLVNEMLELAQVEAGQKVNVVHESVDFSDLVDGATLLFDSMALERNCQFTCNLESDITVNGNTQQLNKLVSTLVENAFKYADDGGTIEVSLAKAGKNAVLNVRNSGSPIAAEDLPHIFDRFYRTDKARTSGAGGFGLGLAIARETARSHGGDITCKSTSAEGTTFTVTLPLA